MKKRKLVIVITIIITTLCLSLIGFYIYNNYYKIDTSQFGYNFLSRVVDSPDGKYSVFVTIYRSTEDSEISYIRGYLVTVPQQRNIQAQTLKTVLWQKVNSSDIKDKYINGVWLDNWIDVAWSDNNTITINNITLDVFKDNYDFRRKW